jgi:hypothetical protein
MMTWLLLIESKAPPYGDPIKSDLIDHSDLLGKPLLLSYSGR